MASPQIDITTLFVNAPIQRSRDLEKAGIQRIALSRYVASGLLIRLRRGLYCLPNYEQNEHGDLAIVAKQIPEAAICLLTALRFHGLTTQAPTELWLALGRKARSPRLTYPELRVLRFSSASLTYGTEIHILEGVPVRITTIEKTVADCFKYRNRIGLDVAIEALREASRGKCFSRDELWACAKVDRITNIIRPYMEALA